MFNNSSKLLFIFTLMMGTMITISSNSWLGAWMGLEINLLSFIPLMINNNNLLSNEASLKYFLTQALASAMFLFSIIVFMLMTNLNWQIENWNLYSSLMINSTLLLKSGAAPFHFWFPGVVEGLSWNNNLILMTWQKIAPLMLISYNSLMMFMNYIVIISVLIGAIGGLNQSSLRKIMAFSSINNLGWMLSAMMLNDSLWLIYFLLYSFLTFTLLFLFNSYQLFHINQTFSLSMNNSLMKFILFLSLLSLGGLPPFLGFFPKWLVIQFLTMNNQFFLIIIMVCLTLVTLYYYMRICYSAVMLTYYETNWNFMMKSPNFSNKMSFFLAFLSLFGLLMFNLIFFI
uniref:NADH dehydrogenase subunit 2 n=1 Tax=Dicranoptycha shandongensis TaxID=3102771 RepID=UPI002E76D291|nr:NADH dehydrogenase subunit 2 [Dicranoptycha shandongensis]WPO00994.1 NADH dehydrogenase subunit 2 [Dicranoptycha shandongensis]